MGFAGRHIKITPGNLNVFQHLSRIKKIEAERFIFALVLSVKWSLFPEYQCR